MENKSNKREDKLSAKGKSTSLKLFEPAKSSFKNRFKIGRKNTSESIPTQQAIKMNNNSKEGTTNQPTSSLDGEDRATKRRKSVSENEQPFIVTRNIGINQPEIIISTAIQKEPPPITKASRANTSHERLENARIQKKEMRVELKQSTSKGFINVNSSNLNKNDSMSEFNHIRTRESQRAYTVGDVWKLGLIPDLSDPEQTRKRKQGRLSPNSTGKQEQSIQSTVHKTENPLFRHASSFQRNTPKKALSPSLVRRSTSSTLKEVSKRRTTSIEKSPSIQDSRKSVTRVRSQTAYARDEAESKRKEFFSKDVENTNDKLANLNLMSSTKKEEVENFEEDNNSLSKELIKVDFFSCMKDESLSLLFWCFLRECYQQEKFSFWLAIEDYRTLSDLHSRKKRALEIIEKYFDKGSEYQLPLDKEVYQQLHQKIETNPDIELFNVIQDQVTGILANIYFPKFIHSDIFIKFLEGGESTLSGPFFFELKRSETFRRLVLYQEKNLSQDIAKRRFQATAYPMIPLSDVFQSRDKLILKLKEPGMKLLAAICDTTEAEIAEKVAKALFCVFDFEDNTPALIQFATSREIRTTRDSKQLFREDKMTTRLLASYVNIRGREWLQIIFPPLIKEMSGSYEVNPERLEKSKARKDNVKRLKKTCNAFCKMIFNSVDGVSSQLRDLCVVVKKEIGKYFPESEETGIAALIFLRFICPALCAPHKFGLVDEPPPFHISRGLILVAKVLQNTSTNMKFVEEYMKELNEVVELNYIGVKKFLFSLTVPKKVVDEAKKPTKGQRDDALELLFNSIITNKKMQTLDI